MNFTDSPYERMMKQVPRPSRHDPEPCPACRERGGDCRKKIGRASCRERV